MPDPSFRSQPAGEPSSVLAHRIAAAANRLAALGGGQVAVAGGRVLAELPLPIGGLVSDRAA
jgi:adenine deaminase